MLLSWFLFYFLALLIIKTPTYRNFLENQNAAEGGGWVYKEVGIVYKEAAAESLETQLESHRHSCCVSHL